MINNDVLSIASGQTVVRARRTTDQTGFSNNVLATLTFDQEDFDLENRWDGSTYLVPVTGFYEFSATVRISTTGTVSSSDVQLALRVGSTSYLIDRRIIGAVAVVIATGNYYMQLTAGQSVSLAVFCAFGGATSIRAQGSALPTALTIKRY